MFFSFFLSVFPKTTASHHVNTKASNASFFKLPQFCFENSTNVRLSTKQTHAWCQTDEIQNFQFD